MNGKSSQLAIVALGSNQGDSRRIILRAIDRLQEFSDYPILRSSLWLTTPVDCPPGSPPFVNAVAGLVPRPDESPESLIKKLKDTEIEFGQPQKRVNNEPRLLDLDLIAFGAHRRATAELALPHQRAHQRRFVLQPLSEVAPELILPGQSQPVQALLDELASDEMARRIE